MDDIISKWAKNQPLQLSEIITILLEYDSLYNDGTLTPQHLLFLFNNVSLPIESMVTSAIFKIAHKKNIEINSLYNTKGELLMRYVKQ